MHGCLLRLKRPGECRSYFAEPQFGSQKDAKAGVCLLALSQGAGKYIREVGAAVEARITPQMRSFVLTSVFPSLMAETQRICGTAPRYESYTADDGERNHAVMRSSADALLAFGCKLSVSLKPQAGDSERREYTVPAEYRSKADAKIAVAYLAAEQGVLDLLRFEGQPIPADHTPAFVFQDGVPQITAKTKRKNKSGTKRRGEYDGGPPAKKQKMERDRGGPKPTSGFIAPMPTASAFRSIAPMPTAAAFGFAAPVPTAVASGFIAPVPTAAFSLAAPVRTMSAFAPLPPKPTSSRAYGGPRSSGQPFGSYAPANSGAGHSNVSRKPMQNSVPASSEASGSRQRRSPSLEDGELTEDPW